MPLSVFTPRNMALKGWRVAAAPQPTGGRRGGCIARGTSGNADAPLRKPPESETADCAYTADRSVWRNAAVAAPVPGDWIDALSGVACLHGAKAWLRARRLDADAALLELAARGRKAFKWRSRSAWACLRVRISGFRQRSEARTLTWIKPRCWYWTRQRVRWNGTGNCWRGSSVCPAYRRMAAIQP